MTREELVEAQTEAETRDMKMIEGRLQRTHDELVEAVADQWMGDGGLKAVMVTLVGQACADAVLGTTLNVGQRSDVAKRIRELTRP